MKFTTAMLFGLALIVGVAVGYMFNPSVEVPDHAAKAEKAKGAVRDDGEAASLGALRARIAELESELARRHDGKSSEEKSVERGDGRREPAGMAGMSPKEWREKMKKDNPEQYARITNGMARIRRDRQERAQRKADFFASIDVSRMPAEARKVHEELQDLIAKREEFEQKMQQLHESEADFSREEIGQAFREMHETGERIRELSAKERDNLMVETARNLGFDDDDSAEVAAVFKEIIENTDSGWGGFGGHGRHGGPGGRRGNRGPADGN